MERGELGPVEGQGTGVQEHLGKKGWEGAAAHFGCEIFLSKYGFFFVCDGKRGSEGARETLFLYICVGVCVCMLDLRDEQDMYRYLVHFTQ